MWCRLLADWVPQERPYARQKHQMFGSRLRGYLSQLFQCEACGPQVVESAELSPTSGILLPLLYPEIVHRQLRILAVRTGDVSRQLMRCGLLVIVTIVHLREQIILRDTVVPGHWLVVRF